MNYIKIGFKKQTKQLSFVFIPKATSLAKGDRPKAVEELASFRK